jgi:hypothetical protein
LSSLSSVVVTLSAVAVAKAGDNNRREFESGFKILELDKEEGLEEEEEEEEED